MTRREEILEKAKAIIVDSLPELEGQAFDESTVINTDTGIDSMGFTLIICRLEAAFDVRIPNRQWQKLSTLGDVVDAIDRRIHCCSRKGKRSSGVVGACAIERHT